MDDFESGAITGWQAVGGGSGGWFVYADGHQPPDPAQSDPNAPFDVPDPPQGKFAAVTDMNGPGTRILYRDLRLKGRFTLQATTFYTGSGPFSSPATLAYDSPEANQQFRIDLVRPSAPIDSVAKSDVLVNVFHTSPGDPAGRQPTDVSMDVSAWVIRRSTRSTALDGLGVTSSSTRPSSPPICWNRMLSTPTRSGP